MIQLQFMRDWRSNNQTPCEMHCETHDKPIFAWPMRKICRTTCSRSALPSHVSSSSPTWGKPNLDRRSGRPCGLPFLKKSWHFMSYEITLNTLFLALGSFDTQRFSCRARFRWDGSLVTPKWATFSQESKVLSAAGLKKTVALCSLII